MASNLPEYTTAFTVAQDIEGNVALVLETGLDVLRAPSMPDVFNLLRFALESLEESRNGAPETTADRLRARLAERGSERTDE